MSDLWLRVEKAYAWPGFRHAPDSMKRNHAILICLAAAATVPGVLARMAGIPLDAPAMALAAGTAILGASFLLLWACDAAQTDISLALALAVVALIAVLPEYSVDMYFTWQAGKHPEAGYAHYAIANMTGANRLLIGVAWGLIVAVYWLRFRKPVRIERERRTELFFLAAATLYAFVIPIKGSLAWYDGVVLLGLYGGYIAVAARRRCPECEVEGPAELLARLPAAQRRTATAGMFLFAGWVILINAAPFCEGLLGTGRALHVSEFVLVQWLAPIASEAPEFTVALVFAWRGQAGLALGSLLSAKLNQWTLLVGMIPGAYALSHGSLAHPLPMDATQVSEILLTAAQSLLGVALLAGLRLSLGGAALLFGLFSGQLLLPVISKWAPGLAFGISPAQIHPAFSLIYLAAAATVFVQNPQRIFALVRGLRREPPPAAAEAVAAGGEFRSPHCATCQWRLAAACGRQESALAQTARN